jgi:hypothetical protein
VRTDFSLAQLADPDTVASEKILRACVHCGFLRLLHRDLPDLCAARRQLTAHAAAST